MSSEVILTIISAFATLTGTLIGCLASAKLTNFRIEQLEKKVDKHNNIIERTFVIEEQIKVINHRIEDLEDIQKEHTISD